MKLYDQKHIQDFYDRYGDKETQRWEKSIVEQVKLQVHKHYLDHYITPFDKVLELGAGTGIFTQILANKVSALTVTDLSPVQLDLNKKRAEKEGYAPRISSWAIQDICKLHDYPDHTFDKIVCYGGPLSYVFEKKQEALLEMKRVLKPGGKALISVMNLWGTMQKALLDIISTIPVEENEKIIESGNLHPTAHAPSAHHCHMFRLEELKSDVQSAGFSVLVLSASNCLSTLRAAELEILRKDPQKWNYFLDLEIRACASPGMQESGTHLIAVLGNLEMLT